MSRLLLPSLVSKSLDLLPRRNRPKALRPPLWVSPSFGSCPWWFLRLLWPDGHFLCCNLLHHVLDCVVGELLFCPPHAPQSLPSLDHIRAMVDLA